LCKYLHIIIIIYSFVTSQNEKIYKTMTKKAWERNEPNAGESKLVTYIAPHQKRETEWHIFIKTDGDYARFEGLVVHISKILYIQ